MEKLIAATKSAFSSRLLPLLLFLLILGGFTDADFASPAEDESIYMPTCRNPLGMNSKEIPDSAISASSSFDEKNVGPQNSRIRLEQSGGAWCPKQQIERDVIEWLQVEFPSLRVISVLETQGRFGNGQGQEYAPHYVIEYQRQDNGRWLRYRNRKGQEVFEGNSNTYTPQLREVRPPIIAKRIRFIPYSIHRRTICMRVELYGCEWEDDVLSYSMPEGEKRGMEVDLRDFTYDGKRHENNLTDGLGQLTDWELGYYNFRLDFTDSGRKGFEWIGWRDDSNSTFANIEIVAQFMNQRNFTAVKIHCNNMFSKDIRVFRRAEIYSSIGGKLYLGKPIVFDYEQDDNVEFGRHVTIPLPHVVGQFLKIRLYFAARWIMISEMRFESRLVNKLIPVEVEPLTTILTPLKPQQNEPNIVPDDLYENESDFVKAVAIGDVLVNNGSLTSGVVEYEQISADYSNSAYISIIIGTLCIFIIVLSLIAIVAIICYKRRKSFDRYFTNKESKFNAFNSLGTTFTNNKALGTSNYNPVSSADAYCTESSPPFVRVVYGNNVYEEPFEGSPNHRLLIDNEQNKRLSISNTSASTRLINCSQDTSPIHFPILAAEKSRDRFVSGRKGIEGPVGSSMWTSSGLDLLWKEDVSITEFPREGLKFIDRLGIGQFGEINLCEAAKAADYFGDLSTSIGRKKASSLSTVVAVKILTNDTFPQASQDFGREVKLLCRLKDPNICQVLGVCLRDRPAAVIMEYPKHGDLHRFLQQCSVEGKPTEPGLRSISHGCLVYMATQIASGMKYLETMNIAHRDLAARNCLVGDLFSIKICDFAICRDSYRSHYYLAEGSILLPVRWMAWESCLMGKYSSKSDVWSFAITLWELLTLARSLPFMLLSEEEVLENCAHFYMADGCEVMSPQPNGCPREIYDLMRECWHRDEMQRPTFKEIHMFLQRKSSGFDPSNE